MPRSILLDELPIRVFIPRDLPAHTVRALRRQLTARRFTTAVRQALLVCSSATLRCAWSGCR